MQHWFTTYSQHNQLKQYQHLVFKYSPAWRSVKVQVQITATALY